MAEIEEPLSGNNFTVYCVAEQDSSSATEVTISWWGGCHAKYDQYYSGITHSLGYRIDSDETSIANSSDNSVSQSGGDNYYQFHSGTYSFPKKSSAYTVYVYSYAEVQSYAGFLSNQAEIAFTIPAKEPELTISFNGNGSTSGSMSPQKKYRSEDITLTANSFKKTGHKFSSWNTNASGTGTSYADKAIYSGTSNLTLYAQWTPATYKVTFNANGGSVNTTSKTVTYGGTYGTLPTPTRANYSFDGWYTAATGGTKRTSSSTVSITSNATLYAHWTDLRATVTYDANYSGASPRTKSIQVTGGSSIKLPDATYFTRSNNTFLFRWNTAADGSGTYYSTGRTVTAPATGQSTTYYAFWENKYTSPEFTSSPSVVRCGANGATDDEGTYFKIKFKYKVYVGTQSTVAQTPAATVSVKYTVGSTTSTATLNATSISTETGTFEAYCSVNPNISVDSTASVEITITDTRTFDARYGVSAEDKVTTVIGKLSTSFFIIDASPQKGIGIGTSASIANRIRVGTGIVLDKGENCAIYQVSATGGTSANILGRVSEADSNVLTVGYSQRPAALNAETRVYGSLISLMNPSKCNSTLECAGAATFSSTVDTGGLTCSSLNIGNNPVEDYIVAYGSTTVTISGSTTAQWRWWKYKTGRCVMFVSKTLTVTVNTAWGSLYEGSSAATLAGIPYPFTLSAVRVLQATVAGVEANSCGLEIVGNPTASSNLTRTPPFHILRPNSATSNTYSVSFLVIGAYT